MLIPRACPASITFTNNKDEEYRLVVEGGRRRLDDAASKSDGEEARSSTPRSSKGGQTVFLTFQIDKPGTYAYYAEPKAGGARIEGQIVVS